MKKTSYTRKFSSLHDLAAFIDSTPVNGWFEGRGAYDVINDTNADFSGTSTHEVATGLMLGGWSDGAKRVRAAMVDGQINASTRPQNYNSVVGFTPNVAAYLAGSPLNMINRRPVKQPARVLSLCYNCAVDVTVKAAQIERNAAKLFNVIAGLERAGVRVDLWVCAHSDNCKDATITTAVKVKSASQPLTVLSMCYPVVHPSMLRRHMLAAFERMNVQHEFICYGRPIQDNKQLKNELAAMGVPSAKVVSYYALDGKSEKEIIQLLK